jgi:hypothetical protein
MTRRKLVQVLITIGVLCILAGVVRLGHLAAQAEQRMLARMKPEEQAIYLQSKMMMQWQQAQQARRPW